MALLRVLSPPISSSTTCLFGETQQTPLKLLSSLFLKTPNKHKPRHHHSLSLSRTGRDWRFETRFSSALESPTEEEFSPNRVYAQNVPWDCTPEDIRALFEKYGTVESVELSMFDKTRNRGLAFVTMGSPEEALQALNNLQSYELNGRIIKLDRAKARTKKVTPPPEPKPDITFNLFVANLSFAARAKDLKEFFKAEGHNAVSAEVIFHDNPKRSLGYGFVSFKSKKEADEALSSAQGKLCLGRPIRLAKGKQFVKQLKPETESAAKSEEVSTEPDSSVDQAETAEGN